MTISEIARMAGVSSAAVSRYLNNRKVNSADKLSAIAICSCNENKKKQKNRCGGTSAGFRVYAKDSLRDQYGIG